MHAALPVLVALATLPACTSSNELASAIDGGCTPEKQTKTDITLVTQCSADRLWVVTKLCERWHGPLSLAVASTPAGEPAEQLEGRARGYMALCTERHVAVVAAPPRPYPVNALRNRAWAMATTSHVLLLDIDFWPSVGARRRVVAALRALPASAERRALVLPALELTLQHSETKNPAKVLEQAELERQIPSSKLGLLRCVANGAAGGAPLRWRPTAANHWEDPLADGPRRRLAAKRHHAPHHRTIVKRVPFAPTTKPTTPAPSVSPETLRKRAFLNAVPEFLRNTAHEAEPSNLRCGAFHPGQDKRAKFPTSKASFSAVFHSFRLIFGRAIISRNGLEA